MTNNTPAPESSAPHLEASAVPPMPTDEFRDRRRWVAPVGDHLSGTSNGETSSETARSATDLDVEAAKTDDENALLQLIASSIPTLIEAERVDITLLTAGGDVLSVRGLHGEIGSMPVGHTLAVDDTAVGHATTAGITLRWRTTIPNAYGESEPLRRAGLDGIVNAPVIVGDAVLGTVNLGRAAGGFTAGEAKLLTDVAAVVGSNLDRLRTASQLSPERAGRPASMIDESPLLMFTFDAEANVIHASRFGASQLGYSPEDLEGKSISALYPPERRRHEAQHIAALLRRPPGAVMSWDAEMVTADGAIGLVRHTARRLGDANGSVDTAGAEAIVVCEDISHIVRSTNGPDHQATHDPLTGLLNRPEFVRRLSELLNQSGGESPGSICYIDIDDFEVLNDTVGRRAGDMLLTELGRAMGESIQDGDSLARLGGDEFAALLPGCSLADAVRVAERLRTLTGDIVFNWGGRTFDPSISVGVVAVDPAWADPDEALERADAACYDAKVEGGDQVSVVAHVNTAERPDRSDRDWADRLDHALADGDLRLVAQTIVPTKDTDTRIRAEILVRLAEPSGDLLAAGTIVPPAERLGLIADIDRWVVWEVTEIISHNRDFMNHVDFLSVNLSAKSIESDTFLDDLLNAIARPGVDPSKLLFEIRETVALSQFSKVARFIRTATAVGCRFALDDFGAGFSTFHYLRRLPVKVLKIDGSLVQDLPTDPIAVSIVKSIAEVAEALDMKTIAEFVEDPYVIETLAGLGVDFAQGYGIGRPGSLGECLPGFTFPRPESLG